jgi:ribosomal protein S18 acetylase RimI-like enzyme
MSGPSIRTVVAGEEEAAVHAIVLAFAADPVARWTWPGADEYRASMPRLVRAFGGGAFTHGGACCTDDLCGAALWLPPGVHPDEEQLGAVLERTVAPAHLGAVFSTFEQMAKFHPSEPHWYLPLIGVDPRHHGKGYGEALMRYALARCDREGVAAYLESTNPRNISLYRRHGFEPLGAIQAGSSPPLVPMLRRPRPATAR